MNHERTRKDFDLDTLLHPARAFAHPSDVVNDADLTLTEKRSILASWASDACAIEAAPELRASPTGQPVRFDDIMEALQGLDRQADGLTGSDEFRRARRRSILRSWRPGDIDDHGPSLP